MRATRAGAHPYADGCLGRAVGGRQVGALSDRIGPQQHAGALRGTLLVNGESVARDAQLALFSRDGEDITVEANNDAVFLVLSGEPIDEPVVGYGPFVMNTQAEIVQAFADFR